MAVSDIQKDGVDWALAIQWNGERLNESRHHPRTVQTIAEGTPFREAWTRRSLTSDLICSTFEKHLLTYLLTYLLKCQFVILSINLEWLPAVTGLSIATQTYDTWCKWIAVRGINNCLGCNAFHIRDYSGYGW